MDSILKILSQGWIGTVVGLAGIVLAVVFYLRSRRKTRLAFQHDHVMLLGGRRAAFPDEVEIRFAGTVVPRITASKIVIWNYGDRTISRTDLVEGDPLRVEVPEGGQILKHTIHRQTRSVNAWNIDQPSPNRLDLTFDFVDPGDGISLEVIHSQPGSELDVVGTIRGIPKGLINYDRPFWSGIAHPLLLRVVFFVGIALGACLGLYGLLPSQLGQWFPAALSRAEPIDPQRIRWVLVMCGFLYAALPGFMLWSSRRRYPASLEPE